MAPSACIVCGQMPTVSSHVLPKALMRDMIDTPQGLSVYSLNADRLKLVQSGLIDNALLCHTHEKATETFDKYGIEFCRTFQDKAESTKSGNGYLVVNPRPDHLAKFAYACVWRHVMSKYGREVGLKLGRYEQLMRASIFEGEAPALPVVIGVSHLRNEQGLPQKICVPPFYSRALPANRWVFTVGYLDFMVFCDQRSLSPNLAGGLAHRDDPLLCVITDGQLYTESKVLRPLVQKMVEQRPKQ